MANYLKAIMAVIGTVVTGLAVYYGNTDWYPIVTSALSALSVYLVPNASKAPAVQVMDVNSAYPKGNWMETGK